MGNTSSSPATWGSHFLAELRDCWGLTEQPPGQEGRPRSGPELHPPPHTEPAWEEAPLPPAAPEPPGLAPRPPVLPSAQTIPPRWPLGSPQLLLPKSGCFCMTTRWSSPTGPSIQDPEPLSASRETGRGSVPPVCTDEPSGVTEVTAATHRGELHRGGAPPCFPCRSQLQLTPCPRDPPPDPRPLTSLRPLSPVLFPSSYPDMPATSSF